MKYTFADAFFFLALMNPRDHAHGQALEVSRSLPGPILTTHCVLMEVGDAFSDPRDRPRFVKLLELIATDSPLQVVPLSDAIFDRATDLFTQRSDKSWSLTDCTSFVVMEQFGITDALTGDHHFNQAGFIALLAQAEQP